MILAAAKVVSLRVMAALVLLSGVLYTTVAQGSEDDHVAAVEAESGTSAEAAEDVSEPADGSTESVDHPADEESEAEPANEEDLDKRLDALLSEVTAADAYGKTINCLNNRKYRHIDILSDQLLMFHNGRNYWVNELKRSCIGLDRNMVIHTIVKGINSLCENDLVYANRRFDMDMGYTSSGRPLVVRATCSLGEFKPIDEVYAQSLRDLVR